MRLFSPPMQRLIAGLALVAAFLVMASVFVPLDTRAVEPIQLTPVQPDMNQSDAQNTGKAVWESVDPHEELRSIGSLENGRYIVFAYATVGGPRYSVFERSSGQFIATLMTAERVHELFPELPLPELEFSSGPMQLMVAPTNRFD